VTDLQTQILAALAAGPLGIADLERALPAGSTRAKIRAALAALRAADSVAKIGDKRGTRYAQGTRPAV